MKVKFVPQNIELEVGPDKTLLQYATENGIEIKSICKGVPSCAECRIRVVDGESNVLPPNKAELELIGTNWRIDSRRLACQIRCYGDITVDMTEQIARQENQTKKVRGYRSKKHQTETQAVQDTMILTEKPEVRDQPEARAPRDPSDARGSRDSDARGSRDSDARGSRDSDARGSRDSDARGSRDSDPRNEARAEDGGRPSGNAERTPGEGGRSGGGRNRNRNRNRNSQNQNQSQGQASGQTQGQPQGQRQPQGQNQPKQAKPGGGQQPQQGQPKQNQPQGGGRNSGGRGGRGGGGGGAGRGDQGNRNNSGNAGNAKPASSAAKPERPS